MVWTNNSIVAFTKEDAANKDFEKLRQQWRTVLLGDKLDLQDPRILRTVQKFSKSAEDIIASMQPTDQQIWPDLSPVHLSVNFRKCYRRLKTIAIAYSVNGTSMYRDEKVLQKILTSLDLINTAAYNSSTEINKSENVSLSVDILPFDTGS